MPAFGELVTTPRLPMFRVDARKKPHNTGTVKRIKSPKHAHNSLARTQKKNKKMTSHANALAEINLKLALSSRNLVLESM